MKIYRIVLRFGGSFETEEYGFIFSDKNKALKQIEHIRANRTSYGMEEEGSDCVLNEEEDKDGVFYYKRSQTYSFNKE